MHNGTTQNKMSLLVIICLTVRELRFDLAYHSLPLAGQEVRAFFGSSEYITAPRNERRCFSETFPDMAEMWNSEKLETQQFWKFKKKDISTSAQKKILKIWKIWIFQISWFPHSTGICQSGKSECLEIGCMDEFDCYLCAPTGCNLTSMLSHQSCTHHTHTVQLVRTWRLHDGCAYVRGWYLWCSACLFGGAQGQSFFFFHAASIFAARGSADVWMDWLGVPQSHRAPPRTSGGGVDMSVCGCVSVSVRDV